MLQGTNELYVTLGVTGLGSFPSKILAMQRQGGKTCSCRCIAQFLPWVFFAANLCMPAHAMHQKNPISVASRPSSPSPALQSQKNPPLRPPTTPLDDLRRCEWGRLRPTTPGVTLLVLFCSASEIKKISDARRLVNPRVCWVASRRSVASRCWVASLGSVASSSSLLCHYPSFSPTVSPHLGHHPARSPPPCCVAIES